MKTLAGGWFNQSMRLISKEEEEEVVVVVENGSAVVLPRQRLVQLSVRRWKKAWSSRNLCFVSSTGLKMGKLQSPVSSLRLD
uniref:Uncharacterized protein n=1 Tax=Nelumbo nucifera TaxID=4432 RepID=A0A822XLX0_NELNU|nr:TPA_asm: hypothetical protein HUJ06_019991 [Nelumbo nucifera]